MNRSKTRSRSRSHHRSRSSHGSRAPPPPRNRSRSRSYETAGEKRKEKQKAYEERRAAREEQKRRKKRARRKNQAGGNQQERRDNKVSKLKQGFTNNPQGSGTASAAGPATARVPLHKPAKLAKGFTAETVRVKQTTFLKTYAKMAAENSGAEKETATKLVELRVFKGDKSPVTRLDQW